MFGCFDVAALCGAPAYFSVCLYVCLLAMQGEATVPSTLGEELDTNPFLRPQSPAIRATLGVGADVPDWKVFGMVRAAKDKF